MITGFIGGLPANGITDTNTTPTNTDSPTFSSMDAGTPHPNRYLIAIITGYDNYTADGPSSFSATIGGVSDLATMGGTAALDSGETMVVYAAIANVPTGTSVDVAFTMSGFSGTMDNWGCTLVAVYNLADSGVIIDEDSASDDDGESQINTTNAIISAIGISHDGDITSRTPYSSDGGSTLVKGHHTSRMMAFIDITPPGGTVTYSLDSFSANNPEAIYGASLK